METHEALPVRHYLSLPYHVELRRDGEDEEYAWRATVSELPGCETRGDTPSEAAERITAAIANWVADALAEGREVPEPRDARAYSGKLLLRMPQTLHAELAQLAEREQVSLNAYINGLLAAAIGWQRPAGVRAAEVAEDRTPADRSQRPRMLTVALVADAIAVAVAAVIAVILLLAAL
jgi:predicted RNase H-like HicB family nuclease